MFDRDKSAILKALSLLFRKVTQNTTQKVKIDEEQLYNLNKTDKRGLFVAIRMDNTKPYLPSSSTSPKPLNKI